MTRRHSTPFSILIAFLAAACGGDADAGWAGAIDTLESGVVVVTNSPEGLWAPGEAWTVTEELRIGSAMAEGAELFGQVAGIVVDEAGRIHVLDRQAREVRTFDSAGAHVRTFAREGAGPGELRNPLGMTLGPDGRIWVADPQNARYAVFTTDGEYVTAHVRKLAGSASPWNGGFGPEGRLHEKIPTPSFTAVVRMDSALEPVDTVPFPDYDEPRLEINNEQMRLRASVPFATRQDETWDPRGYLWTGVTGAYTLTQMDMAADTLRVIHGPPVEPVPVTAEERQDRLDGLDWFRRQGGRVDPSAIPSHKPPMGGFEVSDDGHLWILLTPDPQREGVRYHVFEPAGRFLGEMPAGRPLGLFNVFRGNRIYGVVSDSLGVQYVVRWRVDRGGDDG
ncbi:MAG: hypothetical protein R6U63_12550 [Longimicrobiales bacterium]